MSPRARTCPRCGDNVGRDRYNESQMFAGLMFGVIFSLVGLFFGGWFWWALAAFSFVTAGWYKLLG